MGCDGEEETTSLCFGGFSENKTANVKSAISFVSAGGFVFLSGT
jgi:hypothetical protein